MWGGVSTGMGGMSFAFIVLLVGLSQVQGSSNITAEEAKAIEQMRQQLVFNELSLDYMKTDAYLVPWLRAHDLKVVQAVAMLRKSLQWRKKHNMDNILEEDFSVIRKVFSYWIDGKDKEGRPVLELPLGHWDVRRAMLSSHRPKLTRYVYQVLEKAAVTVRTATAEEGKEDITQLLLIMDMNGYNFRQHGCVSCFPLYIDFISSYEANYPGLAKNISVINCPRISEPLLNLLKNIMTKASSGALKIYGYDKSEWQPVLLNAIEPEQLSVEFGGTKVR